MRNNLPERRRTAGLSQARLGDLLGVSRQTVNAIERGKYDPSLPLAFALADLFGVRIEDIFTPEGRENPARSTAPCHPVSG
ncbi:helix-turn-helix transcriptional regulator [Corynebacterium sp. CCM 9185]|uniref:Helix-turn-helix transcriptional regulator n=1 Tax=Corynebacterium marambiense TaxID=2765364 RepID=A0ABS0VXB0_9CORY|nr:helix-turn-helix transcriptional regulator [Corynebacterium marambiense]MBI9001397.1 helix-turn-helix transcriptional regulator [Corynebacterium marambiense]MCK7664077.1 helix-turn-helix transcriptional regulator [Corynebacterium marambiense]MCX7543414.1 helix-turn-helix transcriptional regulator [Corynebacterium marambiense]